MNSITWVRITTAVVTNGFGDFGTIYVMINISSWCRCSQTVEHTSLLFQFYSIFLHNILHIHIQWEDMSKTMFSRRQLMWKATCKYTKIMEIFHRNINIYNYYHNYYHYYYDISWDIIRLWCDKNKSYTFGNVNIDYVNEKSEV